MKFKILCLFIIFSVNGCKSLPEENEKSFFIPFFNEIIDYDSKETENLNISKEKEYMLLIMSGQIEINKGNNKKGLKYFEESLKIKYSDISYTILRIYYKEKNYLKVKETADLIIENKVSLEENKQYDNLIIYLISGDKENYLKTIEDIIIKIKKNERDLNNLYKNIYIYKNISDIFYFTKVNPIKIKNSLKIDDFTLINFFYKYNLSNSNGEDPDQALNYLILNKNKNNILHNIAIFRVGHIENYHINVYKEESLFILKTIDDYKFEISILEKFYNYNKKEYENLKTKLILKHNNNYEFWYFLSNLEKKEIKKSLLNITKSYDIIKKNNELIQNKEFYIYNIIKLKLMNNEFNVKELIEDYNEEIDKISSITELVKEMVIKDKFDYNYLISMKPLIKETDINLIISKVYYHFENYNKALSYISKSEDENSNIEELRLLKILTLGEKNKTIGLNEAEIYNKENNNTNTKLILLHMKLNNDIDIEKGFLEIKKIKDNDISSNKYITYLNYRYAYKLKKYNEAKEIIDSIYINDNYLYLVDYGKILWKLDKKEESIKAFKDSKEIYDSLFLNKTIKEFNIKKELI